VLRVKIHPPLSAFSRRVLSALVDATVPHTPKIPIEPTEPVVVWLEAMLACFPWHLRRGFPLGLFAIELLPFLYFRFRRFSNLDREARRAIVRDLLESRWSLKRDFIKGFTGLALMGYYTLPEVLKHLGIDHQEYLDRKRGEREKLLGHPVS